MSQTVSGRYVCEKCGMRFRPGPDGIRCPACASDYCRKERVDVDESEQAFLAAIAARPGDHLPLLQYADWLGERGEGAREEFLRRLVLRNRHPVASRDEDELSAAIIISRRLENLARRINDSGWLVAVGYHVTASAYQAKFERGVLTADDVRGLSGYPEHDH